ncbi:MAG TPA: fatty acid desaturase family protein [Candidatus Binataceae bacterium]|nr:fatty acid desaturase family protein [Candidatus Binataceae bacterium]
MFAARSIFTPDELLMLKRKSDLRGAWMVFHAWAVIFTAMAMFVWWPNPATFLLAVAIIGARQLGLAILAHDAAHGLLFNSMRLNDFAGSWLTDNLLFADLYAYRTYHLIHHRFTQQKNDPDLGLSAPFPITRESLKRKIIRDLTGQTAYKQRVALIRRSFGKPGEPWSTRLAKGWARLHGAIISNAVLLTILALTGHWWLYPVLWMVPYFTFFSMVERFRSIAEHSMVTDHDDPFRNTRTTYANWFARAFLAPYFVNYHLEHHLVIAVPNYNQPKMHAMLLAKGYGPRMEIKPGYGAILSLAASKPAGSALRAAA